jgi:hypothetical protein
MLDQSTPAETQVSLPGPIPAPPRHICAECGHPFKAARPHQQFCSPAHKATFQNRAAVEGRAIIQLAKAWRAGRNLGKGPEAEIDREVARQALGEMCSILDNFNADDKAAGRPNPLHYAKGLLRHGRYIDRQRSR